MLFKRKTVYLESINFNTFLSTPLSTVLYYYYLLLAEQFAFAATLQACIVACFYNGEI